MKLLRKLVFIFFVIVLLASAILLFYVQSLKPELASPSETTLLFQAERMSDQPIIHVDLHPRLKQEAEKEGYININGPNLIRVPDWVENSLEKYYLYFAHHKGSYIKMAYTDSLGGDWKMYDEEILPLERSGLVTVAGKNSNLNTLRKYNSCSESIALIEIGKATQKSFEKGKKESGKSSAPTTPHLASPEVVINKTDSFILSWRG